VGEPSAAQPDARLGHPWPRFARCCFAFALRASLTSDAVSSALGTPWGWRELAAGLGVGGLPTGIGDLAGEEHAAGAGVDHGPEEGTVGVDDEWLCWWQG